MAPHRHSRRGRAPAFPGSRSDTSRPTQSVRPSISLSSEQQLIAKPDEKVFKVLCKATCRVSEICVVMRLKRADWTALRRQFETIILQHFDFRKPRSEQAIREIRSCKELIRNRMPKFNMYEDAWALDVMIERAYKMPWNFAQKQTVANYLDGETTDKTGGSSLQSQPQPKNGISPASAFLRQKCATSTSETMGGGRMMTLLSLAEPPVTHLFFHLFRSGLTEEMFDSFLDLSDARRKDFLYAALQGYATNAEIEGVLAAFSAKVEV